jgi:hypothetical protein
MHIGWYGNELKGWKEALVWWVGKYGFRAGRSLRGSRIKHTIEACTKGGAKQLQVRLGEAIYLKDSELAKAVRTVASHASFAPNRDNKTTAYS